MYLLLADNDKIDRDRGGTERKLLSAPLLKTIRKGRRNKILEPKKSQGIPVAFRFCLRQWYDQDYRNRSIVRHYNVSREVEYDIDDAIALAKVLDSGASVSLSFGELYSENASSPASLTVRLNDGMRSKFVSTENGMQLVVECAPIDIHFSDSCLAVESGEKTLRDCLPGWILDPKVFDAGELPENELSEAKANAYEK